MHFYIYKDLLLNFGRWGKIMIYGGCVKDQFNPRKARFFNKLINVSKKYQLVYYALFLGAFFYLLESKNFTVGLSLSKFPSTQLSLISWSSPFRISLIKF